MTARQRRHRPLLAVAAAALAAAVVAGCTGVPSSSKPELVQSLGIVQPGLTQVPSPPLNADPRTIVGLFLQDNAANDLHHNSARAFLTTQAKSRWSDSTVTVITEATVSTLDNNKITVNGELIGTIDPSGIYTPSLRGDGTGTGGVPVPLVFAMKQVAGQWRIDSLGSGLVINIDQFAQYRQRVVYFYDYAENHLVPDPRYTDLTDPAALAAWLLARLASGPRDTLQRDEITELPAQTTPKLVSLGDTATRTGVTKVDIPGAGQLSSANRNRLAAQIGLTLAQVDGVNQIELTDGGAPVRIPVAGSAVFTAPQVSAHFVPAAVPVGLYYIRDGGVVDETGQPLPGPVGRGVFGLTSVALADRGGPNGFLIAGTRSSAKTAQLDIGTESGAALPLFATKVPFGRLSRPDWAPDVNEVWIGDEGVLYRVQTNGSFAPVPVTTPSGKANGRVTAVRLSPEGSRVALVLTNPDGSSQLWVGAVVRAGNQVRVDSLTPISPQGITVTDVAWNDQLKLFAIGHDTATGAPGIYDVQSDGSLWNARQIGSLPHEPDSITVALNVVASVSSGGDIWKQRAGSWVSPQGQEARGTNPIYTE